MRRLLTHRLWPLAPQLAVALGLAALAAGLALGDANPEVNPGMYLLWGLWWPLVPLSFVVFGRLWCGICPVSLLGDAATAAFPGRQMSAGLSGRLATALLVGSFGAVHVANLWFRFEGNLPASVWLVAALGVTAAALTLAFRDRVWCTALCPLGAMGRFLARLSPLRIAGGAAPCAQECAARACSAGGPGRALCPVGIDLRAGVDPGACILCGACLKACPRLGEVGWRAGQRDPASLRAAEPLAVLAFLGLAIDMALTHLNDWPILYWQLSAATGAAPGPWSETALHAGIMASPPLLALALRRPGRAGRGGGDLAALAAAALPLAGAALLAVTLRPALVEGPLRLQRLLLDAGVEGAVSLSLIRRLDGLPLIVLQEALIAAGAVAALCAAAGRPRRAGSASADAGPGRLPAVTVAVAAAAILLWIFSRQMTG